MATRPSVRAGPLASLRRRAAATPARRNRYVDLLRAASIAVVVLGHWLMAAPTVDGGEFTLSDILRVEPWSRWLTWAFQVMPVFFVVGGYANAASLESARRLGRSDAAWLSTRLRRLALPVVPLVLAWSAVAVVGPWFGLGDRFVRVGAKVAFVPTWFLAVYVVLVVVAPVTFGLWRRYGLASLWAFVLPAATVDVLRFAAGVPAAGWVNYVFVWLAVHQLGYAWRAGVLAGPRRTLSLAAAGLVGLALLVVVGPYPVSMVTVPGQHASNSNPPSLALLALGALHAGLLLAAEPRARRALLRPRLWTAVVAVNGSVLTIYLWHATVIVLLVGLADAAGGVGLTLEPGSGRWWAARPLWVGAAVPVLALLLGLFGRFEKRGLARGEVGEAAWRSVLGAMAMCVGLVSLGAGGLAGETLLGLRAGPVALTFAGCALVLGAGHATPRRAG